MLRISAGLAAASAVALAVGIGSCSPSPAPSVPTATGSRSAVASPLATPVASGPVTASLTIYYVGGPDPLNTGSYPLYREVHQVRLPDGSASSAVAAAVRLALTAGSADDPDDRSTWPAMVRVQSASVSGGVATVDLSDVPPTPTYTQLPSKLRHAYIQSALAQLVWTATAVPGVTGVRLLFDGQPKDTLWEPASPVGGVLRRGDPADVLAPVWITSPQQGATVAVSCPSGGDCPAPVVTVSVAGFPSLGVIQVSITRDGNPLAQVPPWIVTLGSATDIPGQETATKDVRLPPGTYTVTAAIQYTVTKAGPFTWDTHTFTVR